METLDVKSFREKIFDFEKSGEWRFEGDVPVIVDFYADWCGPCRMQAPILEAIEREYGGRVRIYKVNTETTPEFASLFRIRGIPALLFGPKTGKPALSSGFMPAEALRQAIGEVLAVPPESESVHGGGR